MDRDGFAQHFVPRALTVGSEAEPAKKFRLEAQKYTVSARNHAICEAFQKGIGPRLFRMNRSATIFLAAALMLMGQGPAMARSKINIDGLGALAHYPGAPKPVQQTDDSDSQSPYPMSYSEEAAENLGVRNGRMQFFDTGSKDNGLAPALTGGVDGSGAMLKLQWHPGE